MIPWSDFHFLRPWWLLLIIIALLMFFVPKMRPSTKTNWAKVIDPHLLPHMLLGTSREKNSRWHNLVLPLFLLLLSFALAGPTLQRIPSDVAFHKAPVIFCLELSEHMMARDINPSRQKRAIYKLEDLLNRYQGAEVALVAFAGDAHLVVPLSDDYNTVLSLAKTLSPDLMPVRGVNISSALRLVQPIVARNPRARVVVITSTNINESDSTVAKVISESNFPVTVWAFATPTGAPTESSEGQFNRGQNGVAISKLRSDFLEKVNQTSGAASIVFSPDSTDIEKIIARIDASGAPTKKEVFFDTWFDLGPYFVLLAMVMFLCTFFFARERWWLFSLVLFFPSAPSEANVADWFLRKDQQAQLALETGEPKKAAELFDDAARKGTAFYRAKMYDQAIEHLSKVNSTDGRYNLGNAYAKKGQYQEAVKAYADSLALDAKNADAKFNKELVEKLLKDQQQKQDQNSASDEQKDKQDEKSEQEKNPSENKSEQKGEQGQGGDKKEPDQQESKKEPAENQESAQPQQEKSEKSKQTTASEKKDEQNDAKKQKKEEIKTAKPGEHGNVDKETQYYFDRIEQRNNLYLKRKFQFESEKNRER